MKATKRFGCGGAPWREIKKSSFLLAVGIFLLVFPDLGIAKQFLDSLPTDFYAGKDDSLAIGQSLLGDLQLSPYSQLGNWTTTTAPSNTSLYWNSVAIYNGKAYLSGGVGTNGTTSIGSGGSGATANTKVWYGTIQTDGSIPEWKEVDATARLPQPTYGHTSVVVNGRYYIIGGRTTGDLSLSSVYWANILGFDGSIKAQYKPNTWTAVANLPKALFRAKTVFFEGRIYVIGGQDSTDTAQNSVYYAMVQPNGNILGWNTASASLPVGLSGLSAAISNGRIYVVGGTTTGLSLDSVSSAYIGTIDPVSGDVTNWTQTTPLPEARVGADAAVAAGKIWVAGGYNSGTAHSEVYFARLNPDGTLPAQGQRDTWTRSTDLPITVYDHSMVSFNGHLLLIGGRNAAGIQNQIFSATLATPKANIARWVPTTSLFVSTYGGNKYYTWTGQTAEIRVPLPSTSLSSLSTSQPSVFVIGGGPNTFNAYANGVGDMGQPAAFSTVYNSSVNSDGSLGSWSAPSTGGSIPIAVINHASTINEGAMFIIGGANTINAWSWAGAASLSITAVGQIDSSGRPLMSCQTSVLYESITPGGGGLSGKAGTFNITTPIPIYDPAYEYNLNAAHTVFGQPWMAADPALGLYASNTATPIYQPLMRHSAVSYNGSIYVIGGISRYDTNIAGGPDWNGANFPNFSESHFETRVWFCHPNADGTINETPAAGGWALTAFLPVPLYDLSACVAYGRIYIFGGRQDAAGLAQSGAYFAQINNDGTLQPWVALAAGLPEALAEHKVVFMNGKFYLIGGQNNTGALRNSVYYCTPDPYTGQIPVYPAAGAWQLSTTLLEYPVAGHSALASNGFLYVLGGRYNLADPHTSSAYMTSVIDLHQDQDIVYAWQGTFERYIDLFQDQPVQNLNWDGNANSESLLVKCRFATESGNWTDWTQPQGVGPFIINQFARYIHYKISMVTGTNEAGNVFRTPVINSVYLNYPESKRIDNDGFQVNHNSFDPQTGQLLITFKTRDHDVTSVILRVYNLEGEMIRKQEIPITGVALPATGTWTWDGTNENGELVANGVYIIQYNSGNTHKIRRIVVLKH